MFEDKAVLYNEEQEEINIELEEEYAFSQYMNDLWKVHEDYENNEFEWAFLYPTEE